MITVVQVRMTWDDWPPSPLEVAWSALVNMTSAAAVSRAAEPGPTLHHDLATHTHTFNRLQLFRLVNVSTYTYMWVSSQSYLVQFRFAGRWHKRKRSQAGSPQECDLYWGRARWRCLCPQLLGSSFLAAVDSPASHQRVRLWGLVVLSAADSGQRRSYLMQRIVVTKEDLKSLRKQWHVIHCCYWSINWSK